MSVKVLKSGWRCKVLCLIIVTKCMKTGGNTVHLYKYGLNALVVVALIVERLEWG